MRTIQTESELRGALAAERGRGRSIGFVPTMGALHEGHLSLIRLSKSETDITVVSIFVNPTQFGPNEDFAKYPRTVEADMRLLQLEDVDILFLPAASEIYPEGASTFVEVKGITEQFEGAIRPDHFKGVATVVASLFNIVQPTIAFFGQKDAQQVAVLKRMVRDLHFPVKIRVGEIIRSNDRLALSSRNRFLSEGQARSAEAISKALYLIQHSIERGHPFESSKASGLLLFEQIAPSAKVEYLETVDSETFRKITSFGSVESCTIIMAARFGEIRLIDNVVIERKDVHRE